MVAAAGWVWIVPKNGAVEVTTSNALHVIVPFAVSRVPMRPSYSRHCLAFTDVAVNEPGDLARADRGGRVERRGLDRLSVVAQVDARLR
ncbi:MAG TPA: hypothetical protein VLB81_04005 [Gaiellales bacterium]|nr:hypothetical protein [Gaiellales bacterium]